MKLMEAIIAVARNNDNCSLILTLSMKFRVEWFLAVLILDAPLQPVRPAKYERRETVWLGVRCDSIFIYVLECHKSTYNCCWKLNSRPDRQGGNNSTVEHLVKNELKFPGTTNFIRHCRWKIVEMPVSSYILMALE
jgi:hypothetical protein